MDTTFQVTRSLHYERKAKLIRRVLIAVAAIYVVFAFFYFQDGLVYSTISNLTYASVALLCLFLLNRGHQWLSVTIGVSLISIEAMFQTWLLGPEVGIPYVFLVIYPFIFILGSLSDRGQILFLLTLNSVAFAASFLHPSFFAALQDFPADQIQVHRTFTIIITAALTVAALYLLTRSNWKFELAMMESKLKLDSIYNSTNDPNLLILRDSTILSYNQAAKEFLNVLLGKSISEGERLVDILPEGIRERFKLTFPEITEHQVENITEYVQLSTGETMWIEQRVYSVPDLHGNPWAISFNLRDVTTEHHLKEEMRARDILLNSINQNIQDGVYRVEERVKIVYANHAFLHIFGFTALEDVAAVPIDRLYKNKKDRENFINRLDTTGRVESMEVEFRRSDGSTFWGSISAIRTKDDKGAEIYDGSIRDITEIVEVRNQLILAKEQAEEATRAKADFLSTMSHEIRTPMNAVIGMTDILLMENPRPDQKENLYVLKFSANHLLNIINDILDLSKIDAGKIALEQTEVSIKELLKSIITGFEPKAKEKHLALNFNLDSDIPEVILTDPTRLNQVLSNLLGNAVKFTDTGSVTISAELDSLTQGRARIRFEVKDTGIGIAPENQQKIFEQFQQEHTYITRKYGGTGLGLTIVKRLLDLLGSEIELESKAGEGSTFYFTLEAVAPKRVIRDKELLHKEGGNTESAFRHFDNLKVLLVEDNLINIKITCRFLEMWGVDTDVAKNGEEAIALARKNDYDLILMDLQMPVMDGFQAATEIRKFNGDVPIVALTASAMLEVQGEVYKHGMTDFLTKPIVPAEFNQKLAEYARDKKLTNVH